MGWSDLLHSMAHTLRPQHKPQSRPIGRLCLIHSLDDTSIKQLVGDVAAVFGDLNQDGPVQPGVHLG
jgi:hypothetical protein